MVQERVALIAQQIQVQTGRIVGVPVEERSIDADGMMVEPAALRIQMKSIKGPLRRGILNHRVIRLEEAGIADAERDLPATVVVVWRRDRNGSPIKPTENETSHFPGLGTAKGEFDFEERLRSPDEFHLPHHCPGQLGEIVQLCLSRVSTGVASRRDEAGEPHRLVVPIAIGGCDRCQDVLALLDLLSFHRDRFIPAHHRLDWPFLFDGSESIQPNRRPGRINPMFQRPPVGPIGQAVHLFEHLFVESERERKPEVLVHSLFTIFRGEEQKFPQARVQTIAGEIHAGQGSLFEPVPAFAYVKMG